MATYLFSSSQNPGSAIAFGAWSALGLWAFTLGPGIHGFWLNVFYWLVWLILM